MSGYIVCIVVLGLFCVVAGVQIYLLGKQVDALRQKARDHKCVSISEVLQARQEEWNRRGRMDGELVINCGGVERRIKGENITFTDGWRV